MNYAFDFVLLVVLIGCAALGFRRGFFRELLDSIALIVGILTAGLLHYIGVHWLHGLIASKVAAYFLEFLLTVTGVTVGLRLIALGLQRLFRKTALALLERVGGVVVAIAKVFVAVGLVLTVLVRFRILSLAWLDRSVTAPLFLFAGRVVVYLLPGEFSEALDSFLTPA